MMNQSSRFMKANAFITILSVFATALVPLRTVQAGAKSHACDSICDNYKATTAFLKSDPTCQSNTGCKSCVDGVTNNAQLPAYCGANKAATRASNAQLSSIIIYGAAAAVCTAACVFTWAGGDGFCTGSTIATGVAEVATVAIIKRDSKDLASKLFGGALSSAGYGMMGSMVGKGLTKVGASASSADQGKNNQSCASAGIMAAIAIMKGLNKIKMDKSAKNSCADIENLAGRTSSVTSCLAQYTPENIPEISNNGTTFASGYGSAAPDEIIDDDGPDASAVGAGDRVAEEILKSAAGKMMPGMSVADFKRRLEGGESISKMLNGIVGSASPGFSENLAALEKQLGGDSLSDSGGKQVAGSGAASHGKEMNFNEIGFGSENSGAPGIEAELNISPDRKIASALSGSDIFHAGYGGTIFQIISQSLINQKPNLQALDPVLPLNRALAGLKNESPVLQKKAGKK